MIEIKEVVSKRDLEKFIQFQIDLYKDCEYYCPPLFLDAMTVFDKKKNPAYDEAESICYLAYKGGKIVGRIAGIISHAANKHWDYTRVRFGWFDFIDDKEVSKALLDAVAAWGKSKGMNQLNGPCGFTDLDPEGLMVAGFDYKITMAVPYNYEYYLQHYLDYELIKETGWIEYRINTPSELPAKMDRVSKLVKDRFGFKFANVKSAKELSKRFGISYFDVIDKAYQPLYNYTPLTEKQKHYYSEVFFPFINFDFVSLITNKEDNLIALAVGIPSLTEALRKCKGKLFPFGWYYIYKALKAKKIETMDFLLIAVDPSYQNTGANALIFAQLLPVFIKYGVKYAETSAILETNLKNQANFADYDKILHRKRDAFLKSI